MPGEKFRFGLAAENYRQVPGVGSQPVTTEMQDSISVRITKDFLIIYVVESGNNPYSKY